MTFFSFRESVKPQPSKALQPLLHEKFKIDPWRIIKEEKVQELRRRGFTQYELLGPDKIGGGMQRFRCHPINDRNEKLLPEDLVMRDPEVWVKELARRNPGLYAWIVEDVLTSHHSDLPELLRSVKQEIQQWLEKHSAGQSR